MKVRSGFVSNSSSSSFIIIGVGNTPSKFDYVELKGKMKQNVIKAMNLKIENNAEIFLTEYVSDCIDEDYPIESNKIIEYDNGGHGGPYDEDDYVCLDDMFDNVWLKKEHYSGEGKADKISEMIRRELDDSLLTIIKEDNVLYLYDEISKEKWEI